MLPTRVRHIEGRQVSAGLTLTSGGKMWSFVLSAASHPECCWRACVHLQWTRILPFSHLSVLSAWTSNLLSSTWSRDFFFIANLMTSKNDQMRSILQLIKDFAPYLVWSVRFTLDVSVIGEDQCTRSANCPAQSVHNSHFCFQSPLFSSIIQLP